MNKRCFDMLIEGIKSDLFMAHSKGSEEIFFSNDGMMYAIDHATGVEVLRCHNFTTGKDCGFGRNKDGVIIKLH